MSLIKEISPNCECDVPDILVVDDDANNLLALEVALEGVRCRQIQASSGEAALRHLLRQEFALILLDIQMPGMDGFETASLIRRRGKNNQIPIIFITAHSHDDTDMRRGYELGAVDYLFKPIVAPVIRAKVQALIDLRARTQEVKHQAAQLQEMERARAQQRLEEERRKWEAEALRKQNQSLEELDRRKDEFLAVLAHELRNPLAPIVNGLQIMSYVGLNDPQLERAHTIMSRQACHLTRLVDDLLDVSRISRGKLELQREWLDLREAVKQAIEACEQRLIAKTQTLRISLPEMAIPVYGDRVRLVQVIVNLLNNASRYSPESSEIEVEAKIAHDTALVRVRDQGWGIGAEAQERIFELFVQEREGGKGLGLGLTLVRQLVDLHRGKVSVHSDGHNKGSEFSIEIPLADNHDARGPTPTRVDNAPEHSPALPSTSNPVALRIVVVEDESDIRETLTWMLEEWGHEVHAASDGPSGVELVQKIQPDVAIVDIGLPGFPGYEVASRIKAQPDCKSQYLIALSGYGQPSDKDRSKEAGFASHLVKPIEPDKLRALLTSLQ